MTTRTLTIDDATLKAAIAEKIAEMLRGYYYCGRVWSAWGVGTMTEDDFSPAEDSDKPHEIADEIIAMLAAPPIAPPDVEGVTQPDGPLVRYATVRIADSSRNGTEWHIECRFADGQKYAPIIVDGEHEDLAHRIADILNATPAQSPPAQDDDLDSLPTEALRQIIRSHRARIDQLEAAQDVVRDADGFYIQDSRGYVGNCMSFWGPDRNGYTTNIDEAGVYTREEAFSQNKSRDTDIPWPVAYIRAKAAPRVDFQYVDKSAAIDAARESDNA